MKSTKKLVAIILATVILTAAVCVGTFAWLISTPDSITNTFVVGENVTITLTEDSGSSYNYLPGKQNVAKDPKITVTGADCWIFVKIETSDDFDTYVDAKVAANWTKLTNTGDGAGVAGVYGYNAVCNKTTATYGILLDNQVDYKNVDSLPASNPTMTLTGYAIQTMDGVDSAAAAWAALDAQLNSNFPTV